MAVSGLIYVAGFLNELDELALLAAVDVEPWRDDLKRRVQHYGYRFDYTSKTIDPSMYLGPLPDWARPLAARLVADGHMAKAPDQLIVNEYKPGQGINAHVDSVSCFGSVVCSLTLGSHCVMELSSIEEGLDTEAVLLERGSLLVLAEDARYKWRHGIRACEIDSVGGNTLVRGRRVSLTFRTVIVD